MDEPALIVLGFNFLLFLGFILFAAGIIGMRLRKDWSYSAFIIGLLTMFTIKYHLQISSFIKNLIETYLNFPKGTQ